MADYDLELVQNATYERAFTWKKDGLPQSLADYASYAQVRAKEDQDSELLLDLGPYMTREAANTKIRLRVPGSVLADLEPRDFKRAAWDLVLVHNADPTDRVVLLEGAASLNPATTVVPA
jgi:hypothetical protein